VPGGQCGALGGPAVGGGQGDQVQAVELVTDVAPGVTDGGLDDPDEQQRQPAQLHVGADAVLAVVKHRAQPERALHVPPPSFDRDQLLVGGGEIVRGEGEVGGPQQPLAVQVLFSLDRGVVDTQQPGGGAAQVAAQTRLGAQGADQFVAAPRAPGVGSVDELGQVRDQVRPDLTVPLGRFGVVTDHEPLGPRPLVAVPVPAGATWTSLTRRLSATLR